MSAFPSPPLGTWARRRIAALAADQGGAALAHVDGAGLLVERAALHGWRTPGAVSAGGGCRLHPARGDVVALALPRPDDRAMLAALFEDVAVPTAQDGALAAYVARADAEELVARGRSMGLAIARVDETPSAPAAFVSSRGAALQPKSRRARVVDLSALWAGPLAGRLLGALGCEVIKVENRRRPDGLRTGGPHFFDALNAGKLSVALDFDCAEDRRALRALIDDADIVIESSRPRALLHYGVDADAIVRTRPIVWISVTAHGVGPDGAAAIGFGDDCSVAGGLSAALRAVSGRVGFGGDALADPATGIVAAAEAWSRRRRGEAARVILSMDGVVAAAIAEARDADGAAFDAELAGWAAAEGRRIAPQPSPGPAARAFGADTHAVLRAQRPC